MQVDRARGKRSTVELVARVQRTGADFAAAQLLAFAVTSIGALVAAKRSQRVGSVEFAASSRRDEWSRVAASANPWCPTAQNAATRGFQIAQAQAETASTVEALQAQLWATTLTRAALISAGRGGDELAAWLPNWDPVWLGLNSASLVSVRRQAIPNRNGASGQEPGEDVQLTVAEFWREFLKQHGMESYQSIGSPRGQDTVSSWPVENLLAIAEFSWHQLPASSETPLQSLTIDAGGPPRDQDALWRWSLGISWLVLMMALGSLASGSLRSTIGALGELIWPMWLVLTIASALLLPVLWPAVVIALGLVIVLVRRYRELRRDRRFVLMPKRMR